MDFLGDIIDMATYSIISGISDIMDIAWGYHTGYQRYHVDLIDSFKKDPLPKGEAQRERERERERSQNTRMGRSNGHVDAIILRQPQYFLEYLTVSRK